MARSIKKGPYVVESLVRKIETLNRSGEKRVLKTWARRCTILPEFVGHTLAVHNGNKFLPIYAYSDLSFDVTSPLQNSAHCEKQDASSRGSPLQSRNDAFDPATEHTQSQ